MVVLFDWLPILTRLRACPETASFPASSRPSTDAGLRPALWNDVVVRINEFAGGRASGLHSKDSISKFGVTHYYCGADPRYIHLYSDTYSRFDPLTRCAAWR